MTGPQVKYTCTEWLKIPPLYYMRKGFLLHEEMHKYLTLYEESFSEENLIFFFISVGSRPGEDSWHGIYSLFRLLLQEAGGAHAVRRELVPQKHVCKQKKAILVKYIHLKCTLVEKYYPFSSQYCSSPEGPHSYRVFSRELWTTLCSSL